MWPNLRQKRISILKTTYLQSWQNSLQMQADCNVQISKFRWKLREVTICIVTFCKNIENISWNFVKKRKWNVKKSLAQLCRLLDRDFQPPSYNDYDFSLPPQYQGTACVLYATAIISKLFSTTPTTFAPGIDICKY